MKKKISALILLSVILAGLTACGGNNAAETTGTAAFDTPAETSEEQTTEEETTKELTTEEEQPVEDVEEYVLRVMQFNIQTENGNSTPFSKRSDMFRKLIDEYQPDVVGMEEVTVNWLKWLDKRVFSEAYAGVGEARTAGGEANSIYYRKDKFDLVDSGTFWLSDTPDKAGSSIKGANYPRICTWVHLKHKTTGYEFAHMNTHLDHNGNNDSSTAGAIRKAQMGVIIKFAQRFKDIPLFLTGDLNNRRTTGEGEKYALIKMIEGDIPYTDADGGEYTIALKDARLNAPVTVDAEHTATMTKYYDEKNEKYDPSREPIDYVFYDPRGISPLKYETFLISENGAWISDHLPVLATFAVKTN